MTTTSTTYARGTKTHRVTTAKLAATPGAWVLTTDAPAERKALLAKHGIASDAEVNNVTTKTGATLRQVERAEAVLHTGGRRATRTYTIHFTDGTYAHGNSPATTWTGVEAPAEVAPVTEPVAEETPAPEVATEAPAATGEQVLGRKLAAGHRIKIKGAGVVLVSAATIAGRKVTVAWIANGVTGTTEVWASSRFRLAA